MTLKKMFRSLAFLALQHHEKQNKDVCDCFLFCFCFVFGVCLFVCLFVFCFVWIQLMITD